jgi:hypothetical protein
MQLTIINIHSNIFTDFVARYDPSRKHAWLCRPTNPGYITLADKDMEQEPTQQQVTNWVVDFLNGRLNEELAKLTQKG